MERWMWAYILQQVVLLGAWCWLVRMVWREVQEMMRKEKDK